MVCDWTTAALLITVPPPGMGAKIDDAMAGPEPPVTSPARMGPRSGPRRPGEVGAEFAGAVPAETVGFGAGLLARI